MNKIFQILTIVSLISCVHLSVFADNFDDLSALSDDTLSENSLSETDSLSSEEGNELDFSMAAMDDEAEGTSSGFSISVGGYLKTLAYWNQEEYSDLLWGMYQQLAADGHEAPDQQKLSGYNNLGSRLQLKLEGYLGNSARLFTAFNINYNLAGSLHASDSSSDENSNAEIRMIESFIEIYEGSRTWKIGSQLVTWGYMEGIEVPTDRVNARDQSYKSTEYEDSKLPSTGILLTQRISDSQLELMFIPVSRQNISQEFSEYLYTGTDEIIERKANKGKGAARFSGTIGNLDAAISYVEGLDVNPDLTDASPDSGRTYNRVKSPGLDLQYNFGSFLAKLSYVYYQTEDEDGTDPYIKNSWNKYAAGIETTIGGSTINLYAGQILIENFQDDAMAQQTNFLLGQIRERTDFISGHVNANFLTGDALNLVLMVAGYWDEEGEAVQSFAKATLKYKIADGLDVMFSPMYGDYMENKFTDAQAEVKYSF